MLVRKTLLTVVVAFVIGIGSTAQATVWDAYSGFHTTGNDSNATWQYLHNVPGTNSGYVHFDEYGLSPAGYNAWSRSDGDWEHLGKDPTITTELVLQPYSPYNEAGATDVASTIGWKSPVTGLVNVSFSLTDRWPNATTDGVEYWLFKSGSATALANDILLDVGTGTQGQAGNTTGIMSINNVAVASGDMLYLQVGPRGRYNNDLVGFNFTVSEVPEPGTLTLILCGLSGLLAYAWRKLR